MTNPIPSNVSVVIIMTSWYTPLFLIIGPLERGSVGHRWIPHTIGESWGTFDVSLKELLNKQSISSEPKHIDISPFI